MFARPTDGGKPVLGGLIDMDVLSKHRYDEKKSGQTERRAGSGRPQVGGVSGAVKTLPSPIPMRVPEEADFEIEENTYRSVRPNGHYVLTMAGGK
jgi:hypothetical protein